MFTPLEVKSAYSLLQSSITIKEYVTLAKKLGYTTVVLSEWETMTSALMFYEECIKQQVKPIIGLNFELFHQDILVLPKNTLGYFELVKLSSLLLEDNTLLSEKEHKYNEIINLLNTFSHIEMILSNVVTVERLEKLQQLLVHSLHISLYDDSHNLTLAKQYQLPAVVNHKVEYLLPSQYQLKQVLLAIKNNTLIKQEQLNISGKNYLFSAQVFHDKFSQENLKPYLDYTKDLLEHIHLDIPVHQKLLPTFDLNAPELLREIVYKGFDSRLNHQQIDLLQFSKETYVARLEKELNIIIDMGFANYFLIVWDLMAYAHQENIMIGAGRGSSAASLVSYCLNITQVDPIKYDLLFERFLNPERYTMPDIDLDFPDNKRQQMIDYVVHKYGVQNVAQISTFGTLSAKQVLRDVARVFNCTQLEMKQISSAVLNDKKITLDKCYEYSKKFRDIIEKSDKFKLVFHIAKQLEGLPRHISTHAAAVVISDKTLSDLVPMQKISGTYLTQFTMNDVEHIGLLKMDFLGLKNLSILADAIHLVQQQHNNFNIWQINYDDQKVFRLFSMGDTNGVFQFESSGIKNTLKQVKPNSLLYLAAVNALYRPGPMEQIKSFADRKHEKEYIQYPHDSLETILKQTHGIIVYQEQVMQIAYQMAGFSLGQADLLRRAIGKMKKDVMLAQREVFITGAQKNGYTSEEAQHVYDYIEKFANYGFPKSHALAYSVLAYQLAYIKVYYPAIFYLSLLKHTPIKTEKFNSYLIEAKRHNITVLPPHINESFMDYTIKQHTILFGLSAISGLKYDIRQFILSERLNYGPYKSFDDFILRVMNGPVKSEHIENIIFSGALDCFGETRATLINNIDVVGNKALSLFNDTLQPKFQRVEEYEESHLKMKAIEILGYSFMPTLQDKYFELYEKNILNTSIDIGQELLKVIHLLGTIEVLKVIQTKQNKKMAFITLDDSFGTVELVLFPEVYTKYIAFLKQKNVVYIQGKVQQNEDVYSVIVNEVVPQEHLLQKIDALTSVYYLKLDSEQAVQSIVPLLKKYTGQVPVVLYFSENKVYKKMSSYYYVDGSQLFEEEMINYLGIDHVKKMKKNKK